MQEREHLLSAAKVRSVLIEITADLALAEPVNDRRARAVLIPGECPGGRLFSDALLGPRPLPSAGALVSHIWLFRTATPKRRWPTFSLDSIASPTDNLSEPQARKGAYLFFPRALTRPCGSGACREVWVTPSRRTVSSGRSASPEVPAQRNRREVRSAVPTVEH
jgi:hypothetical protein